MREVYLRLANYDYKEHPELKPPALIKIEQDLLKDKKSKVLTPARTSENGWVVLQHIEGWDGATIPDPSGKINSETGRLAQIKMKSPYKSAYRKRNLFLKDNLIEIGKYKYQATAGSTARHLKTITVYRLKRSFGDEKNKERFRQLLTDPAFQQSDYYLDHKRNSEENYVLYEEIDSLRDLFWEAVFQGKLPQDPYVLTNAVSSLRALETLIRVSPEWEQADSSITQIVEQNIPMTIPQVLFFRQHFEAIDAIKKIADEYTKGIALKNNMPSPGMGFLSTIPLKNPLGGLLHRWATYKSASTVGNFNE